MITPPGPGSWIIDEDGTCRPDMNDPAMAARYSVEKPEKKEVTHHERDAEETGITTGED